MASSARLKRAESFLGIHFDFHAGPDCTEIGRNTTSEMIENVISQVQPDYIQIDCKGHPGLSSYPTTVGNQAPGIVGDPLRLWREVTAANGVALYMHYSGVWDSEAVRQHPEWAVVNADGTLSPNATSFFGGYADELLIPQLRELAGAYGVDGAWIDGECWAALPDYGDAALKAFHEETGIPNVPRKPGDPHWFEFLEFNREAFRKYLRNYITQVTSTNPQMQLCSNWAFTDHMPDPVSAPVDWISGDYSPEDSLNSARFSARLMARQGKPWDLMAWSFARPAGDQGHYPKSVPQLQREAAAVLSLGGGFQAYFTQKRDGSVREEQLPLMAAVARFCRARQRFCHGAIPIPQVAMLYPTASHYRTINGLFSRDLSRLRGTLQALLECQQSVEVLAEHQLTGRMAEYPFIVVPECDYLGPAFKQELLDYVEQGGSLLLIGPDTASMFEVELCLRLKDEPMMATRYLAHEGALVEIAGEARAMLLGTGARPFGEIHASADVESPSVPAASIARHGNGQVAATCFCFSKGYLAQRSEVSRGFLHALAREIFPRPIVEVEGSSDVDLAVNRIGDRLAINLVNTSGPHADVASPIHDTILPIDHLVMRVRCQRKPESVVLQPEDLPLPFDYDNGVALIPMALTNIHSIIMVEEAQQAV